MASSDDFKQQLKAGNIKEALTLALNGAVDLKITTWVTSAANNQKTPPTKPGHRLRTRINTLNGSVENEIGDQFIGNGRYRELRQFHSDQVADSNKIIHSNLKSLQKLFEVLIAMQEQTAISLLERSPQIEQLLPPAQEPSSTTLLTPAQEAIFEIPASPNSLTEEITQPLPLTEVPSTFTVPAVTPAWEEEEEEEDDDWDNSVLDLLESLPVGEPEADIDSFEQEDLRNFIEEEIEPELDAPVNQDQGILTRKDLDLPETTAKPETEQSDLPKPENLEQLVQNAPEAEAVSLAENWEKLSFKDFQALPTTPSELLTPEDDDWGDLVEDEPSPQLNQRVPSLESLDLEAEEEWDDWVVESEPLQDLPITRLESLDLAGDDDNWDDFEESSLFATAENSEQSKSSLESDADWDNFSPDELEPYTGLLDLDTNVDAGFDLSDTFELTPTESSVSETELSDLRQNQQARRQPPAITKPSDAAARDLMDVLFGDEPQNNPADVSQAHPSIDLTEEELFADLQFEQFLADGNKVKETNSASPTSAQSERQVLSDNLAHEGKRLDDLAQPQSLEKNVPPPPPPSQLPNQNN